MRKKEAQEESDKPEYVQAPSDFVSLGIAIIVAIVILGLIILLSVTP